MYAIAYMYRCFFFYQYFGINTFKIPSSFTKKHWIAAQVNSGNEKKIMSEMKTKNVGNETKKCRKCYAYFRKWNAAENIKDNKATGSQRNMQASSLV